MPADRETLVAELAGTAHAWYLKTDAVSDPSVLAHCAELLSAEERERFHRFRFDPDRRLYMLSHAMLRRVLSMYADFPPEAWLFTQGPHGRPELAGDAAPGIPLRFNLTHTRGLAACVITLGHDCGVDAEELAFRRHASGIAERMFADEELQYLQQYNGPERLEAFFTLWTLREAYCKACGTGLANSGRHFRFASDAHGRWQLHFSENPGRARDWHVAVERIPGDHVLAVAVRTCGNEAFTVRYREFSF